MASESSSITIETVGASRRVVELKGPALPHAPAAWKGRFALATTWYQGMPEATQQMLGPQEVPSEWEGSWHRTLMGKHPSGYTDENGLDFQITTPFFMMTVLEDIFRTGALLKVTWTTQPSRSGSKILGVRSTEAGKSYSIVRFGRASTWEFPVDRVDDIGWKITFDWKGRGGSEVKVASTRQGDPSASVSALDASINDAADVLTTPSFATVNLSVLKSASQLTLGKLEALANAPLKLVQGATRSLQKIQSDVSRVVGVANTLRTMPFAVTNALLASARNTVAVVNQTRDQFSRMPPEAYTTKRDLASLTRSAAYLGTAIDKQRVVARRANDMEAQLNAPAYRVPGGGMNDQTRSRTTHEDLLGVHVVKAGETPQSVSLKWYGASGHALDILKANKLPWNQVTLNPGTVLIIPRLQTNLGS